MVALLLAAPAIDVNARNEGQETPLLLAIREMHLGVVRLLLADHRVDVSALSVRYSPARDSRSLAPAPGRP